MFKKMLSVAACIAAISMLETACSKKEDPSPSTPGNTTSKLSTTQTGDIQSSTGTVKKSTEARSKTSQVSGKLKKASVRMALAGYRESKEDSLGFPGDTTGGGFPMPNTTSGNGGFDTTGYGSIPDSLIFTSGENFTVGGINQSDLASIDGELENSIGGDISFLIVKDTIIISINFDKGKDVLTANGSGPAPTGISGKMTVKSIFNGTKSISIVIFDKYKEDFAVDSLDFEMDGTINDEIEFKTSGEFTTKSKMNITITEGTVKTSLIGDITLVFAASGTSYTENGSFVIKEGTETYTIKSVDAMYDLTCLSAEGLPTGGKQTIEVVSTKARSSEDSAILTLDYGTGSCDGNLKVIEVNGEESTLELKDLQ